MCERFRVFIFMFFLVGSVKGESYWNGPEWHFEGWSKDGQTYAYRVEHGFNDAVEEDDVVAKKDFWSLEYIVIQNIRSGKVEHVFQITHSGDIEKYDKEFWLTYKKGKPHQDWIKLCNLKEYKLRNSGVISPSGQWTLKVFLTESETLKIEGEKIQNNDIDNGAKGPENTLEYKFILPYPKDAEDFLDIRMKTSCIFHIAVEGNGRRVNMESDLIECGPGGLDGRLAGGALIAYWSPDEKGVFVEQIQFPFAGGNYPVSFLTANLVPKKKGPKPKGK